MKYAKIGGQAVIEGIMMRCGDDYAVAVRTPDRHIEIKKEQYRGLVSRFKMRRVPIIRGVLAFVDSLYLGMKTLTYSAGFYEDEEEEAKESGHGAKTEHPRVSEEKESFGDKVLMGATVVVSIAVAVGLFMILPFFISNLFSHVTSSVFLLSLIEGIVRVILFLGYLVLISKMKDIQRTFMYHGAEHKTINCIEHGEELTVENAMKYSRFHKRCGTSFLLIVVVLSVIFFMLFFTFVPVSNTVLKVVIRLLLVPVIAGVSYEIIQWAGRGDNAFVNAVSKPGMWMQKLTTREPDPDMLEVAIASIEAIYDWRAFQESAGTVQKSEKTEAEIGS
ncbi:MAG TPA: DUF1385 domain-containing protein [Candidatus Scybalocola faecipullorum]|nr:DUF1385 domain-containing protein [Candidatus Scybalocola faecipullorum]